jgi:hypothetical protein
MNKKNNKNEEYANHFENVANLFPVLFGIINKKQDCKNELIDIVEESIDYLQNNIDDKQLFIVLEQIKICVNEYCNPVPPIIVVTRLHRESYEEIQVVNPDEPSVSNADESCSCKELEKLNKIFEEKRKQYS